MTPPPEGDAPRFTVAAELLRLATDDAAPAGPPAPPAPTAPTAAPAAPAADPAEPPAPEPSRDVPMAPGATTVVVAMTAGAAATFSTFSAVWLHAARIERALHASSTGIEAALVGASVCALGAAPFVGLASDRWGRLRVSAVALAAGAVAGGLAATSGSVPVLAVWLAIAGAAASGWATGHLAWLAAAVPGPRQGKVFAAHALAVPLGVMVGALAVWRWGLLLGLLGLVAAAVLWRSEAARSEVSNPEAAIGPTAQGLRRAESSVGLIAVASVVGLLTVGAPVLLSAHLQHHWHLGLAGRNHALLLAGIGVAAGLAGSVLVGRRPANAGVALGASGVLFAGAAYARPLGLVEVLWAGALAGSAAAAVGASRAALDIVAPAVRGAALGVLGAWGLFAGGVATIVLAAAGQADGSPVAQIALGVAVAAAGVLAWRGDGGFSRDAAAVAAAAVEQRARTGPTAALEVRRVDFSYGARQILFGVAVTIEEGEVAALLGTNGAGKSTLLRLVAGLDHPSGGTIRIAGRDTTFVEAEQIGGLGVALLSGGRMSFPGLTVIENLRVGGHRLRRQGPRLRAAIDEAMALFPVLAERSTQRVGTLSGGEQQMLALARVLLTRPRLLLIDELSLGLAPKAVEGLLAIVRRVNSEGATVLLVEQSANLALTLAAHAYVLERGEVRFDGPTAELLTRDDLLRPVFLGKG